MSTDTQSKSVVQSPAGAVKFGKIAKIEKLPREPVYNMEVATVHNFSVEGGLIVHNCMDEVRYGHNHFAKTFGLWGL